MSELDTIIRLIRISHSNECHCLACNPEFVEYQVFLTLYQMTREDKPIDILTQLIQATNLLHYINHNRIPGV